MSTEAGLSEDLRSGLQEQEGNERLIGGRRNAAEVERDWTGTQLEQPVTAAGLQVVVALGLRRGDQLDLPRVEAEALIGLPALRLEGAVVGQEDALRDRTSVV